MGNELFLLSEIFIAYTYKSTAVFMLDWSNIHSYCISLNMTLNGIRCDLFYNHACHSNYQRHVLWHESENMKITLTQLKIKHFKGLHTHETVSNRPSRWGRKKKKVCNWPWTNRSWPLGLPGTPSGLQEPQDGSHNTSTPLIRPRWCAFSFPFYIPH